MKTKIALAGSLIAALIADAADALTRQDLEKKLQALAKDPAPTKLAPGAMCYKVAMPPERIEYVCPACGERTLHAVTGNDRQSVDVVRNLDGYRRLARQIKEKGLEVSLDEAAFCKKCGKDAKEKGLYLEVKNNGEKQPHRSALKSTDDLTLVLEFLEGKKTHDNGPAGQKPLKDYLPRIRELLGFPAEKK